MDGACELRLPLLYAGGRLCCLESDEVLEEGAAAGPVDVLTPPTLGGFGGTIRGKSVSKTRSDIDLAGNSDRGKALPAPLSAHLAT